MSLASPILPQPFGPGTDRPRWHDAYPRTSHTEAGTKPERDSLVALIASYPDPYTDEQKEAMRAEGGWNHNPFTDVED